MIPTKTILWHGSSSTFVHSNLDILHEESKDAMEKFGIKGIFEKKNELTSFKKAYQSDGGDI